MNFYFLFIEDKDTGLEAKGWEGVRSCREYVIRYFNRFFNEVTTKERNIYFGHSGEEPIFSMANLKLPDLANKIWKDKTIECEIIKLSDIKDSDIAENFSFSYNKYNKSKRLALRDIPLLKVNKLVNPIDISLLLYLSWFGIDNIGEPEIEEYLFAKLYSDLIPDFYTNEIGYAIYNMLVNGPILYIISLSHSERKKIDAIYKEHGGYD